MDDEKLVDFEEATESHPHHAEIHRKVDPLLEEIAAVFEKYDVQVYAVVCTDDEGRGGTVDCGPPEVLDGMVKTLIDGIRQRAMRERN